MIGLEGIINQINITAHILKISSKIYVLPRPRRWYLVLGDVPSLLRIPGIYVHTRYYIRLSHSYLIKSNNELTSFFFRKI